MPSKTRPNQKIPKLHYETEWFLLHSSPINKFMYYNLCTFEIRPLNSPSQVEILKVDIETLPLAVCFTQTQTLQWRRHVAADKPVCFSGMKIDNIYMRWLTEEAMCGLYCFKWNILEIDFEKWKSEFLSALFVIYNHYPRLKRWFICLRLNIMYNERNHRGSAKRQITL